MNEPHTEDEIIEMFTDVERRPEPPREAMDRAFAAVEEEWESVVSQRRRRAQRRRWAVAAAVLVAVAGTFAGLRVTMTPAPTALLVQGDVVIGGGSAQGAADSALAAADSMPAAAGTTLAAVGTTLELDPAADIVSRTASRWVSETGVDLRLAQDSRVRWTRTDEIELARGDRLRGHRRGRGVRRGHALRPRARHRHPLPGEGVRRPRRGGGARRPGAAHVAARRSVER